MTASNYPKISSEGNALLIADFPAGKMTQQDLAVSYSMFEKSLESAPGVIFLDVKNVTPTEANKLAFIDSCKTLSGRRNIPIRIKNCSSDLHSFLDRTGFFKDFARRGRVIDRFFGEDSIVCTAGAASIKFTCDLKNLISFIGEIFSVIWYSIAHPKKIQYRETLYYMDKTGADGVPIVFLLCFLMGAILGYQGVAQMGRFGLSIFVPNLVGASIVKELGALMVAVICIGRAGSSFAAEIGTMKVSEEIDAMTTMGLRISRFLVFPKIVALIVVMPMLTLIGDIAGLIGGMTVCIFKAGISASLYYDRVLLSVKPSDFFEGMTKSVVFAIIIGAIGCLRGIESENDAKGVGRASTSAVVSGIFLMVIADAILTTVFN